MGLGNVAPAPWSETAPPGAPGPDSPRSPLHAAPRHINDTRISDVQTRPEKSEVVINNPAPMETSRINRKGKPKRCVLHPSELVLNFVLTLAEWSGLSGGISLLYGGRG